MKRSNTDSRAKLIAPLTFTFESAWNWLRREREFSLMSRRGYSLQATIHVDQIEFQSENDRQKRTITKSNFQRLFFDRWFLEGRRDPTQFSIKPGRPSRMSITAKILCLLQVMESRKSEFAVFESILDPATTPRKQQLKPPHEPDPVRRLKIEEIAVKTTSDHFRAAGYIVDSRESDNLGWDLDATNSREHLRLEVKGLSGSKIAFELTPNEFAKMQEHKSSYRLCIVTNAIVTSKLHIFAFCPDSEKWENSSKQALGIRQMLAARCKCE